MPRAFTQNEKEEIERRLLEQGYNLFTTYGLKKTNVEDIAQAVGISKGAFYSFYTSKEDLFMAVIEQAETRVRKEILANIELPGRSPRARLVSMLQKAFALLKTIPLLQLLTGGDYDLLFRKLSVEKLKTHLGDDMKFIQTFTARCQEAGIPIRVRPEEIVALLFPLVIAILHEDNLGRGAFRGSIDLHLELTAAYALGEIDLSERLQSDLKETGNEPRD